LGQATAWYLVVAEKKTASDEKIALTYGVAIAVAGAWIGAGVFFGLRHSGQNKQE